MLLGLMGAVLVGSAVMLQTDVLEDEDISEAEDDSGGDDYGDMFDQIPTDEDGFDPPDSTAVDNTDAAPFDDFLSDDGDDLAALDDDAGEDAALAASADFDRLYGDDPDDDFLADILADDLGEDDGAGLDFLDDAAEAPADDDDPDSDTVTALNAAAEAEVAPNAPEAAAAEDDSADDGADVIWLDNADLAPAGNDPFFDLDDWLDDEHETEITGYNPEQDKIVVIWDDSDDGEVPELRIEPVEGTDDVQLVVGGTAVSTVVGGVGLTADDVDLVPESMAEA
ncbi:MAG: hypothetical protein ABNH26_03820 [Celeribacter sp.]